VKDVTQYCDLCTNAQVETLTKTSTCPAGTSCCAGCGRRGTCAAVCPMVMCDPVPTGDAVPAGCTSPTPSTTDTSTSATVKVTHDVTVVCSDPSIGALVSALGATAQDGAGNGYPGSVAVTQDGCVDNAAPTKRQAAASTLTTTVNVQGPAANTAMDGVLAQLSNTQVVAPGGATATYQSSSPTSASSGLSGGAIAGIVIGSVAAAVIVVMGAVVLMKSSSDTERY